MTRDIRVCFVGDSFVAGIGDPEHLGWTGRVLRRSRRAGLEVTGYGLGVRRQTSRDVLDRWHAECAIRLPDECDCRVVASFGVNDTTVEHAVPRVPATESAAHLGELLTAAAAAGWPTLVVGPPPIADRSQNARIAHLDTLFAQVCRAAHTDYISVVETLLATPTWTTDVAAGDGSHPAADGYQLLADHIWPHWHRWIATTSRPAPSPATRS